MNPVRNFGQALKIWWREWVGIMFLNLLWLFLQLTIVLGPPATAVLYTICQKMHDDETWDFQDVWLLFRQLFWPAWKWAIPNLLFLAVLLTNFYVFQSAQGSGWVALRIFWGSVLVGWFILNLFYWPFWLAQEDRSLRTTYANAGRMFILHPLSVLVIAIATAVILTISLSLVFMLAIGVVGWLALVGIVTVQSSLAIQKRQTP